MWVTAVFDMSSHVDAGPYSLSTEVPTGRMTLVIPSEARNLLFACSPPALLGIRSRDQSHFPRCRKSFPRSSLNSSVSVDTSANCIVLGESLLTP